MHDENCAAFGGVSGHAGLFASGEGLIKYLQLLFGSEIGEEIRQRNLSQNEGELFGLQRGNSKSSEVFAAGRAVGHFGFTGVAFWLELESLAYGVFFTNRTLKKRLCPEFYQHRRYVFANLWQSLH